MFLLLNTVKKQKLNETQPQFLRLQAHYWIGWVWDSRKMQEDTGYGDVRVLQELP